MEGDKIVRELLNKLEKSFNEHYKDENYHYYFELLSVNEETSGFINIPKERNSQLFFCFDGLSCSFYLNKNLERKGTIFLRDEVVSTDCFLQIHDESTGYDSSCNISEDMFMKVSRIVEKLYNKQCKYKSEKHNTNNINNIWNIIKNK